MGLRYVYLSIKGYTCFSKKTALQSCLQKAVLPIHYFVLKPVTCPLPAAQGLDQLRYRYPCPSL